MDTEEALSSLGRWSKWQMTLYTVVGIAVAFPTAWQIFSISFIGGIHNDFTCTVNVSEKDTLIPKNGEGQYENCKMYSNYSINNQTTSCQNGWTYWDKENVGPTIVTTWDLVCGKEYLADITQMVLSLGILFGAICFTVLADLFGRKPVLLFCEWAMVVVGVATAFVTSYYAFTVLRFFAGALHQGIMLPGFIMACELFSAKQRTFAGMAVNLWWALSVCVLGLFAYLVRNWRYLQLLISLPGVLTVAFYWLLPESIPWLVANGRGDQATAILKGAAKFNGVRIPNKRLSIVGGQLLQDAAVNLCKVKKEKKDGGWSRSLLERFKRKKPVENGDREEETAKYTILDIFKHRMLLRNALITCLLWFTNVLVYYGLSLNTASLAGDRYLNFFLSGLVEFPAYGSSIYIIGRWGRKYPLIIFQAIAGVALLSYSFLPSQTSSGVNLVPLIIVLNMIGKFGITGSFGIIFLYTPEIFPTTIRSQAMGIASVGGRLGLILSSYTRSLALLVFWLPPIFFAVLAIGAGLTALLLPETLNRPLPQTIEEIESWATTKPTAPGSAPALSSTASSQNQALLETEAEL